MYKTKTTYALALYDENQRRQKTISESNSILETLNAIINYQRNHKIHSKNVKIEVYTYSREEDMYGIPVSDYEHVSTNIFGLDEWINRLFNIGEMDEV